MAIKLGSHGPLVSAWQHEMLRRYPLYAKAADGGPLHVDGYYGYDDRDVQREYERRTGQLVDGIVSERDLQALGIAQPPARKRHLAVVFRGTGGIIGHDYVSLVCQAAADLVEEIHPVWPATMGGIPVGAARDPKAPSMRRAVEIAVRDAKRVIRDALDADSDRRIIIGGYSAGAVVAAHVRQWLHQEYPENYCCSFSFGDPTRPYGGSYYQGPTLDGQGIASWHYGDPTDWRHAWLTDPNDMYANIPLGVVGEIMRDCYDIITNFELADPLNTARAIVPLIPQVAERAGIPIPAVLRYVTDGIPGSGIMRIGAPAVLSLLAGIGKDPATLTGTAAAARAARIAIEFAATGTAPHIEYHRREVWPGQTHVGLAVQHVRHYATR